MQKQNLNRTISQFIYLFFPLVFGLFSQFIFFLEQTLKWQPPCPPSIVLATSFRRRQLLFRNLEMFLTFSDVQFKSNPKIILIFWLNSKFHYWETTNIQQKKPYCWTSLVKPLLLATQYFFWKSRSLVRWRGIVENF